MRRRRRLRSWAAPVLLLCDAAVFVLYALSRSLPVLVAGVVGLLALAVGAVAERIGLRSGRHRRAADEPR